jgi:RNA polymerase sigma-70 factor (ECF subfamily)
MSAGWPEASSAAPPTNPGAPDPSDEAISRAIEEAPRPWAGFLAPPLIHRYVTERVRAAATLDFVPDLVLACGVVHAVPRALEIFERDHADILRTTLARRLRDSSGDVDDALQTLRERLLVAHPGRPPAIAKYAGRGPLRLWLRIVADRHALRLLRDAGHLAESVDGSAEAAMLAGGDPELAYLRATYRDPFRRALSGAIRALSGQERTLLRLRLHSSLNPEQIAELYHVHRTTVIRWLVHAREHLHEATRRRLMDELSLGRGELSSLIRLIGSELPELLRSPLEAELVSTPRVRG